MADDALDALDALRQVGAGADRALAAVPEFTAVLRAELSGEPTRQRRGLGPGWRGLNGEFTRSPGAATPPTPGASS
ncbi:hypothetical protein ACFPM3_04140 [Streptomyces coeruleoprunus]|uniref:Uncharacterized protein n=1 Tax=Streptomyces coeruleoprunus TaxID=285563 RepID=A0ABV9XBR3_9ACTN